MITVKMYRLVNTNCLYCESIQLDIRRKFRLFELNKNKQESRTLTIRIGEEIHFSLTRHN